LITTANARNAAADSAPVTVVCLPWQASKRRAVAFVDRSAYCFRVDDLNDRSFGSRLRSATGNDVAFFGIGNVKNRASLYR
jgi:hypothetical protein